MTETRESDVGERPEDADVSAPPTDTVGRQRRSAESIALWVFVAVEVGAFALWFALGRGQWFRVDEWDFLSQRTAFDLHDLFADHGNHWKTLPILVYRLMWWAFGIRSYLPYLTLVILSHLTVAALLRVVMRRLGVNPWIATAAASLFALFGAGHQNIVWAFQIGLNASVALGLVQVMLADRDGPVDRKDWLGAAIGLAAVMCAGAGVALVGAAALVALVRRGWRVALVHAGIPATATLVWWAAIGREGHVSQDVSRWDGLKFVRIGVQEAFEALGQIRGMGIVLGVLLVSGLALAWTGLDRATLRRRAAVPVALMLAALVYLGMAGFGGAFSRLAQYAADPHFKHVTAALVLPAIAVACEAFGRRWPIATPVLCVLLLVGIPGNIDALATFTNNREPFYREERRFVFTVADTKAGRATPDDATLGSVAGADYVTLGWLRAGLESGRIPRASFINPSDELAAAFRLAFVQSEASGDEIDSDTASCEELADPAIFHFERGDRIGMLYGSLELTPVAGGAPMRASRRIDRRNGTLVTVIADSVDVRFTPASRLLPTVICIDGAGGRVTEQP